MIVRLYHTLFPPADTSNGLPPGHRAPLVPQASGKNTLLVIGLLLFTVRHHQKVAMLSGNEISGPSHATATAKARVKRTMIWIRKR